MTYAQNTATAGNTAGLPSLTVGPKAGSGANFDPGTNPTSGDVLGTDCTTAFQAALNAAVASPYSVQTPAKITFQAGVFLFGNAGVTLAPLLIKSAHQVIEGAGKRATKWRMVTSPSASVTVPLTTVAYTNPHSYAAYYQSTGGTVTAIAVNGVTQKKLDGSGGNALTGNFCVQGGGTIAWTYTGVPTVTENISFLMWNVAPLTGGISRLEWDPATNSIAFANGIDVTGDPNNGVAYSETTRPVHLEDLWTGGATTSSGTGILTTGFDILLDGCEEAPLVNCECLGPVSYNVSKGNGQIDEGFFPGGLSISGQQFTLKSVTTTQTITINGSNAHGDTLASPANIVLVGHYSNPMVGSGNGVPTISNNNAATNTVLNILGGTFYQPPGAMSAGTGWFQNNLTTLYVNLQSVTFFKQTNTTIVFTAAGLAGLTLQGLISFGGAETAASFYTNTIYSAAAANAASGLSSPYIVGAAIQVNETGAATVLTVPTPSAAGTYRISISIDCISSTAGIGGWTATWDDSGGNEQAPANLELYDSAVLLGAFTFTYTAGHHYFGSQVIDIDNSADNIIISTTKTSGTFSITVTAIVERLA